MNHVRLQAPGGGSPPRHRGSYTTEHRIGFRTADLDWYASIEITSTSSEDWTETLQCIEEDTGGGRAGMRIEGATMALIGFLDNGKWTSFKDLAEAAMGKKSADLVSKHFDDREESAADTAAEQRFEELRDREITA